DLDATYVSFRWKDYRENGRHRSKVMRLDVGEFMRRFLLHVLPTGFHRIRHYGLFANGHRAESSNSVDGLSMCHRREPRTPTAITPARPPPTTNRHLVHAAVVA